MGNKLLLGLLVAIYALPASADIYMGTDATPPASYQSNTNYPNNVATSDSTAAPLPSPAAVNPPAPASSPAVANPPASALSPALANPPASTSSPAVANPPASTSSPAVANPPVSTTSPAVANPPVSTTSPVVANPPMSISSPAVVKAPVSTTSPVVANPPMSTSSSAAVKGPASTTSPAVVKAPMPTSRPAAKASAPTPAKNDQAAQQQPLAHVDTTTTTSSMKPPLDRPASASITATTVKPAPTPVVATPAVKSLLPESPSKPLFTTVALPGSLKDNVERIVAQSHWGTVVWNLPIDYNWSGTMTINAPDVQEAIAQLLAHYPVQATFYEKNHIVSIEARRAV